MTDASGVATSPQRAAATLERPGAALRGPFAHCEIFEAIEAARAPWAEIASLGCASPYQGYDFLDVWARTVGRANKITPFIVVARDEEGRANAVLPLGRVKRGPIWSAEFLGGKDANFKMGLFRPGVATTARQPARSLGPRRALGEAADRCFLADQPAARLARRRQSDG